MDLEFLSHFVQFFGMLSELFHIYLIPENLRLGAILSKGCSLYSSKDKEAEVMDFDENTDDDIEDEPIDEDEEDNEEAEDIQEDYHLDDLLDQDLNWELEIARRRKRWKAKEEEMRESSGKVDSGSTLHPDSNLKGRQPKQIFSSQGASGILINDLVSIMETVGETAIRADSVEDNIFQWSVKMSDFGPESSLSRECAELKRIHGYDYIELQMGKKVDINVALEQFLIFTSPQSSAWTCTPSSRRWSR